MICVYRQRRGYLQDLFLVSMFRIDLDAVSAMIFLRKAYLCQFDRVKIEHITIILRLYSLKSHKRHSMTDF